jgi:uncharacterized protein YdeI (YjbR/CyaY-like superfamily)
MSLVEVPQYYAKSRQAWRAWLQENHQKVDAVWLIYFKKNSKKPSIVYSEAVDEALCFGWIDSKAKPISDVQYMQFFCKRRAKSVWSRVNKEKILRLTAEGLMTNAGYAIIDIAKANGSWTILDDAEALIIPKDLESALLNTDNAQHYFSGLSRSDKRNILAWLVMAKRTETRANRIAEIVSLAAEGKKPKQFTPSKKV